MGFYINSLGTYNEGDRQGEDTEVSQRPDWRYRWTGEAWEIPLNELKDAKWAEIKAERDYLEQAGVPYLGKVIDSDTVSIQRIAIAVQAAQAVVEAEQPFKLYWTMQDNTTLEMDAAQVVGMSVSLAQYSNSLHQIARALREQIDAAKTAEELKAIKWPE